MLLVRYTTAVVLVLLYGVLIWPDSASLTAGTTGSVDPARRYACRAFHVGLKRRCPGAARDRLDGRSRG